VIFNRNYILKKIIFLVKTKSISKIIRNLGYWKLKIPIKLLMGYLIISIIMALMELLELNHLENK
jgi:hypothetical protein